MIKLKWDKPLFAGDWHELIDVELARHIEDPTMGVYIIFYTTDQREKKFRTVRLGSGDVKDRLNEHKGDTEIVAYKSAASNGALHVSWAKVPENQMLGVEKYLSEILNPVVGERFPDRTPIEVNLPWD